MRYSFTFIHILQSNADICQFFLKITSYRVLKSGGGRQKNQDKIEGLRAIVVGNFFYEGIFQSILLKPMRSFRNVALSGGLSSSALSAPVVSCLWSDPLVSWTCQPVVPVREGESPVSGHRYCYPHPAQLLLASCSRSCGWMSLYRTQCLIDILYWMF